jgi:hypothetical protein
MSRAKLRAFEEAERVACARLRRLPPMTEAMRCEVAAHKAALEGANETFIDCLMWLIQNGPDKDLPFHIPIHIPETELDAAIAYARLSSNEYMACVRVAADEANWVYDCVHQHELLRLKRFN